MISDRISFQTAWQLIRQVAAQTTPGLVSGDGGASLKTFANGTWTPMQAPEDKAAADLLDCFLPLCHPARDNLVIAQIGQSLDGRIATVTGASHYINGSDGLDHLHRLRAVADIVVVGAGTVRSDNPQLTVRRVDGNSPDRAVIDPRRCLSTTHRLFDETAAVGYRLVTTMTEAPREIAVLSREARVTPSDIVHSLRERGYRRIFVEGGSQTVSSFLQAGCLDHLHLIVAPMIIGSGIPALQLPEIDELDTALRPETHSYPLGSDYLFDMRLKPWNMNARK